MSYEIPKLRANHPDAIDAFSRGRDLLVETFPLTGASNVEFLSHTSGARGIRINTSNRKVPASDTDFYQMDAELWVPKSAILDKTTNLTVTRHTIYVDGPLTTHETIERSHQVQVLADTDLLGVMRAGTKHSRTVQKYNADSGVEDNDTASTGSERYLSTALEIDVFLKGAIEALSRMA